MGLRLKLTRDRKHTQGASQFCRGEAFRQIIYWLKAEIYYRNASPLWIYLQNRDTPHTHPTKYKGLTYDKSR
jgi:hypothetical protein